MENVKDRIVLGEDSKNHFKEKIHNQEQLAKEITAFALLVNALVHRDYSILSSIRIFIFKDRIEIISPGVLPNHLNEENIRLGISIARNPILLRYASRLMPYRGVGSGILRALSKYSKIDFENNQLKYEFKVTIWRGN